MREKLRASWESKAATISKLCEEGGTLVQERWVKLHHCIEELRLRRGAGYRIQEKEISTVILMAEIADESNKEILRKCGELLKAGIKNAADELKIATLEGGISVSEAEEMAHKEIKEIFNPSFILGPLRIECYMVDDEAEGHSDLQSFTNSIMRKL